MAGLLLIVAIATLLSLVLAYQGKTREGWILFGLLTLPLCAWFFGTGPIWTAGAIFYVVCVLFLGIPAVRARTVTPPVMAAVSKILPRMSETEQIALDAGTVWWDAELFSGGPDWDQWFETKIPELSESEQTFLDGPVNELCALIDDYTATETEDLPAEVWQAAKDHGFFGMIIPEEYGGLGFSAQAHSAVVAKLSSRSTALAVTVMVPNSLGPAELLLHYGTDAQKKHYLPRLANGEEIPCFALTEPSAGSDAGSMTSYGVVCKDIWEGREVLGIRLNWDKRYITLAPVATLLGLAFQLKDPDGLLGAGSTELGITCALIPTDLPGIETGARHDPLGVPFMNGPTRGHDVFVPIDFIIGGQKNAGKGWMMLMQSLSAGRGVSLPSLSAGASKLCTRAVSAYASVREQFKLPIGRFEGVGEVLARISGTTYYVDAVRRVTAGSVDLGEKPSVISAIAKCYTTEAMRQVVTDSMDIVGGAGISLGPRNIIARLYTSLPIGITVEGANILTRTMIIFGQGALRCHPHAQHEVRAAAEKDVVAFDRHFWGHVGFVMQNIVRSVVLGWTNGSGTGAGPKDLEDHVGQLTRYSAAFALVSDVAMGTLGSALKRKESLTGRLADALSWMYIGSCTAKQYADDGERKEHLPYARWCMEQSVAEIESALRGAIANLPSWGARQFLRAAIFPIGSRNAKSPSDRLSMKLAHGILGGRKAHHSLSAGIYEPDREEIGLGRLIDALEKVVAARDAERKLKLALRAGDVKVAPGGDLVPAAVAAGVLTEEEGRQVAAAVEARREAVAVDEHLGKAAERLSEAKPERTGT